MIIKKDTEVMLCFHHVSIVYITIFPDASVNFMNLFNTLKLSKLVPLL